MEIKVLRQVFTQNSTIGQLFVDGSFECWTLEDVVRPVKVFGETAVPAGRYQVVISMSDRFKVRLPLLVDVPEFTGVRIHPGNTKVDTLGCILVGQSKSTDAVGASRAAFNALMPKFEQAAAVEKISILIVDEVSAERPVASRGRRVAPLPPALREPVVERRASASRGRVAGKPANTTTTAVEAPAGRKRSPAKKLVTNAPTQAPTKAPTKAPTQAGKAAAKARHRG